MLSSTTKGGGYLLKFEMSENKRYAIKSFVF
jgi:hypothetical protein